MRIWKRGGGQQGGSGRWGIPPGRARIPQDIWSGGACFEQLAAALGDEEELQAHRKRLIDLILTQAL